MATKHNITKNTNSPLCPTSTHRLLLPLTFSISFILCFGLPFDGKNVLHTNNIPNANGYVNSYGSKSGVSKYPKKKQRIRIQRFHVRHI